MNPIQTFNSELIYSKVFAFWAALTVAIPAGGTAPAFKTATRVTKHWDDVSGEDQPALYQMQSMETPRPYKKGLPQIWDCEITLYLYVRTNLQNDPTAVPSSMLNPLLDAIKNAIVIDDFSTDSCTLGGLVSSCKISGPIRIYEGDLGDEAVATVPVVFTVSP